MGIFFNKNIKSLIEVKVNGQEMSYDDNKNKNTPVPAEDNKEEKPAEVEDNNPAPTEEPDKPEDEPVDDEPANDYRANFDDDTNADNAEGEEAPTDTATDDETPIDSEGGTDKSSELKDIEKELFKDLSPEQIQIRDKELKSKYLELYNTINDIITRTGNISKTSANSKLLNFITDKLFELKNLLFFYMENTYITKSYMENSVNYQQCLATLSMINKLFDEMRNKK